MGGGIEPDARHRLVARLAAPEGGIVAIQVPRFHDLGERRKITDGVEVGVFLHVVEVGEAVLDHRLEQVDGSLRTVTTLRRDFPGQRL